jgi:hypothetical protein
MSSLKKISGCSTLVILYGIFIFVSLIMQCFIPAISLYAELTGYDGLFKHILNPNFLLPLEQIIFIWTIMVPLYIGVDRAASFMFITKEGRNDITIGHPERLVQIIVQSFILYATGAILSLIFDRDLQLQELATSFGLGVLLYVSGKKSNTLAETLKKEKSIEN